MMIKKKSSIIKEYQSRARKSARQGVPKGVEEMPDLDRPIDFPRRLGGRK